MRRVMIVGQPGSGKSWLANRLGQATGLPVFHMDHIHYMPGWVERPMSEKIRMATEIENGDAWIFEGGLSRTYAHRIDRCDTLILLDLPFWRRFARVLWRTVVRYGRNRPDMAQGCPESFNLQFLKWMWRTRKLHRTALGTWVKKADHEVEVVVLRGKAEVARYLAAHGAPAHPSRIGERGAIPNT